LEVRGLCQCPRGAPEEWIGWKDRPQSEHLGYGALPDLGGLMELEWREWLAWVEWCEWMEMVGYLEHEHYNSNTNWTITAQAEQ